VRRLHSLTDAQRAKLSEWAQQWIAIGLSTEPADRPTFERAVRTLYLEQGRKPPSRVIWTGSPLAVDLVMMHLTTDADTREFDLSFLPRCVAEHVHEVVRVETGSRAVYGTLDQLQSTTTKRRYFHGPFHAGGWWTLSGRCAARYGSPATASFLQDVCGIELPVREARLARALQDIARSAGCWLGADSCVVVSERPQGIRRDQRGRLHCENAPALIFRDGSSFAFWHGVRMPLDVVLDRSTLTLERILKEPNAEVARVMVSLYDEGRFLRNVGAEVVHQDDFGTLYRYRLHGRDLLMVKVVNSTPEPDGSFKDYFLGVHPELRPLPPAGTTATAWFANHPPQILTARNAVASTFSMTGEEYSPDVQT
jgi:Domain of unknown function (DUF6745)